MAEETPLVDDTSRSERDLSNQQLYNIIGDRRLRYTVHYLKQRQEEVSVRDVAEQVAAWENAKSIGELSSQERKRVYISLYQSHLPSLDEQGIVEYDEDRKTVTLTPTMANRNIYLEIVPRGSVTWSLYYLGLSIGAAVLLVVLSLDLYPLNLFPDLLWAGLIVATLIVSSAIHIYQSRRMRLGDEGPPPGWDDELSGAGEDD